MDVVETGDRPALAHVVGDGFLDDSAPCVVVAIEARQMLQAHGDALERKHVVHVGSRDHHGQRQQGVLLVVVVEVSVGVGNGRCSVLDVGIAGVGIAP